MVILDTRNDYEYDVGQFRGAIRPDITTFRELAEWVEENKEMLEGKRVLTYCTGGIRCAKFTGWMLDKGLDVAQLEGGIVTYGQDPEVQGKLWDGQCYVFDERITVPINRDRKSTRLNSSHVAISYAVFCLKKKKKIKSLEVYYKRSLIPSISKKAIKDK